MESLLMDATGGDSVSNSDVKRVRELFEKYSPKDSALDADALSKAISVWDDEMNLSEGMFSQGLGLPELSLPNIELPQLPDASKTWEDTQKSMAKAYESVS